MYDTYVGHDVDSAKLLHQLSTSAEDQAANCFRAMAISTASPEQVSPFDGVLLLIFDAVLDLLQLGKDIGVFHMFGFQTG